MAPEPSEKSLPHNLEAERSVLGAILVDNGALHQAQQALKAEDFYREGHRRIYLACERLGERGMGIDFVTVRDELERNAELEASGGAAYLTGLVDGMPRSAHIEHYVHIVKDRASMRRLITVASEILRKAYAASEESDTLLDEAERMVFAAGQERLRTGFLPAHVIAESTFRTIEELSNRKELITGIETGFSQLDDMTSGLQRGELIIVAARPSMGKTAFCLNLAAHAALRRGTKVGIFSLEMSREQLFTRMICAEGRIDAHALRRGMLNKKGWNDLRLAFDTLSAAPIWIDDTPGTGITEMRAKVMRLKAEHGLDMVMVDYLQLMSGRGRYESRQQEISDISRSLKEMAKELAVPVVAASQLSRAPEQRGSSDRRPQLSDLRECLAGETLLTDSVTGQRRPIAELFAHRQPVHVFTLTNDDRLAGTTAALVVQSGKKPVFRLRTRTGREIRASANHPFLTIDGWRRLDGLSAGTEIAVPRRTVSLGHPADRTLDPADSGPLRAPVHRIMGPFRGRSVSYAAAAAVMTRDPDVLEEGDVLWDPIVSIEADGTEMTYDLMVPGTHNFVANDIVVHNSGAIEQDADVVMFIFRPEVYGETADNKGLAEILLRKQRNGPTGDVQLMFVKDFTLFANPEFRSE